MLSPALLQEKPGTDGSSIKKNCTAGTCPGIRLDKLLEELLDIKRPAITKHLKNIFEEHELSPEATVKEYLTVRSEGKRKVNRQLDYYNLDMIISVGYRVKSQIATRFRIWAAHGHTAAELIYGRADADQPNMGVTNFSGNKLLKRDGEIAKNYLYEAELSILNRMVTAYLEIAEIQALNQIPMTMQDWVKRLQ